MALKAITMTSGIGKKAFSLVELLVAIAILSIGIITVLQAFSYSSRGAGLSFDIVNALFLAEDKMQELEFKEKEELLNFASRKVNDKKDKFSWQYSFDLDTELNLYHLNFNISWERINRQQGFNITTYLRK